jgi:hypothetical protein
MLMYMFVYEGYMAVRLPLVLYMLQVRLELKINFVVTPS